MPKPLLFATGMFRSGTTLLSRLLNSHPDMTFASDPYFQIFRALRNAVVSEIAGDKTDPGSPLDDYYFDRTRLKVYETIRDVDLQYPTSSIKMDDLQMKVKIFCEPYSPKIIPYLKELQGDTFKDLFDSGLQIIEKAYAEHTDTQLGFKETWVDEFAPHILDSYPHARVLHIVRDPRAICASKNATNEKYPWLFLVRQWRKLASLALMYERVEKYKGRVLVMKYEDLIKEPTETVSKICTLAGLSLHDNMVDPGSFRDGSGGQWSQNSTYSSGNKTFNVNSIDKWRDVLTNEQAEFIEKTCWFEMKHLGYEPSVAKDPNLTVSDVMHPLSLEEEDIAGWLRTHLSTISNHASAELALEKIRAKVLSSDTSVSAETKRGLCLEESIFDMLQGTR